MKRTFLYKTALLVTATAISHLSFGQFQDSRSFSKSVAMTDAGRVSVRSRHGNINISSWDKDSLVVNATISGQSKSLGKLNESMANTTIDFKQTGSTVDIATVFSSSTFSQGVSDVLSAAGVDNEISVVYEIKLPKGTRMALTNKYGDIYLTTHTGRIDAEISHGNFRALSLSEVSNLHTNFGDVYIESVKELKGHFLFSTVEIEQGGTLDIISKSSEFEMEKVDAFRINTSNDKIDLDEVGDLNAMGSLSKFNIDKLTTSSSVSLKYGKIRIKDLRSSVCSFSLTTARTTVDLRFQLGANKKLNGILQDCEVEVLKPNSTVQINSDSPNFNVVIGNESLAKCTYQFSCQKGKIYIQ
jgi:hypothetical protein